MSPSPPPLPPEISQPRQSRPAPPPPPTHPQPQPTRPPIYVCSSLIDVLPKISSMGILLALYMFISAIAGMQVMMDDAGARDVLNASDAL